MGDGAKTVLPFIMGVFDMRPILQSFVFVLSLAMIVGAYIVGSTFDPRWQLATLMAVCVVLAIVIDALYD